MPAYVIVEIAVKDPVRYEEYKEMAERSVKAFGGEYIVRGKPALVLEGEWRPKRLVVLQFPSRARARQWYASAEYGPAMKLRHQTAETNMILVEGV